MKPLKAFSFLILSLALAPFFVVTGSGIVQSAYSLIQDEGSNLTRRSTLNFAGSGVSCVDGSNKTTCTISGSGGSGYATVQDQGVALTQRSIINFTGSGVTCVDDPGNSATVCDISGGGGASVANYQQSFVSQTTVSLTHNMNSSSLLVQCFNSSNVLIIPDSTTLTTVNTATVTFLASQSGFCNVNATGGGSSGGGGASTIAYASLPAASTAGLLYNFSDSLYTAIDGGSSYSYAYGSQPVTPPASSGWTNLNIGSATLTTAGYRNIYENATNSGQIRGQYRALPSAPYDVKVGFLPNMFTGSVTSGVGLYSSGDGKLTFFYPNQNMSIQYQTWNSVSSPSGNYINLLGGTFQVQPMWARFTDDNTDRRLYMSVDGLNWYLLHTVSRTDFHTPDSFFFGTASFSTTIGASVTLMHYSQ